MTITFAEQSAAGTQNVSAAAEEQLTSMEEIQPLLYLYLKWQKNYKSQIGRFKIYN
ncbi:hypothetical protein M3649_07160 [Ureibacillus chungkukjangi]|nr:hypothetical protein [Ureibacillus chungkukjangi]MCM3387912.1 hypothetical protein [Ureibacillus chungkukjangi]